MAVGTNDPESMSVLLHNLRIHGPQLEALSKDTLDRAFVTFRNASQDERLNIMTRLNLLELVELRAKSWLNSDGSQTYYKHKASNVEVRKIDGRYQTFINPIFQPLRSQNRCNIIIRLAMNCWAPPPQRLRWPPLPK